MNNNYYDCLVLGAGVAGLAAGIHLQKIGVKSLIIEKEPFVGGLCSTQTIEGCNFNYGLQLLELEDNSNGKEVLSYLGNNHRRYPFVESIYLSKHKFVGFPLQRNLIDLPTQETTKIIDSLKLIKKNPKRIKNIKDWFINLYGRYLCSLILLPYEEKRWSLALDKLDSSWGFSNHQQVSFEELQNSAMYKLSPNRYYYYPQVGDISILIHNMSKVAGPIELNAPIEEINLLEKYIIAGGNKYYYGKLISTIPLDSFIKIVKLCPADLLYKAQKMLKKQSMTIVNLVFDGNCELMGSTIHFPEKKFLFRQVSILQNICSSLYRKYKTAISVEVSAKISEKLTGEDLLQKVLCDLFNVDEFSKLGCLLGCGFMYINFAQPLPLIGVKELVIKLKFFYQKYNVYHIGMGGNFEYCRIDQAYQQGKEVVQKIYHKETIVHYWI